VLGINEESAMKKMAAWTIYIVFLFGLAFTFWGLLSDAGWGFRRSPQTGICYEMRDRPVLFGWGSSMSPVDDKYCEEEAK